MAQPLFNVLQSETVRAVGADVSSDLPVNPLVAIFYTLKFQQLAVTDTVSKAVLLADVLNNVSLIEVLFRGTTVVSGSLMDICVLNAYLTGRLPVFLNQVDQTNGVSALTVPIFLGRMMFAGKEGFPATRRGELTLHRTFGAAFTRQVPGNVQEQIETLEILGGEPSSFLKYVTLTKLFAATGDADVDLPMGNPIAKALLFSTSGFSGLPSAATIARLKLLVDNIEYHTALATWEGLKGRSNIQVGNNEDDRIHTHVENLAAAYAQDASTGVRKGGDGVLANYAWLDFDLWNTGEYAIQTAGRGRVNLRVTAGSADTARVLPVELVSVAQAAGA